MENHPHNLLIIYRTGAALINELKEHGISEGHFTNGTYSAPSDVVLPTTLAGFNYVIDHETKPGIPLIIAVNSAKSMLGILDKKGASEDERNALENQQVRAEKVAIPLALEHPDRKVVIVFYDEETPNKLYDELKKNGFGLESLHKWGYGTKPGAPVIEGAENFNVVYGFPLPNDDKPLCADITRTEGQQGVVKIVDLRGTPYLTARENPSPSGNDQNPKPR
jgi:hypothetical protein